MIGLPGFLYDTYKQYKKDTEEFIFWLAETAHECGYVAPDDSTPHRSSEGSSKRKKNKQKGKEAARVEDKKSFPKLEENSASEYVFNSHQLIPRARAIVSATNPTVQIPTHVVQTIEKAVSARKRCTSFFQTRSNGEAGVETSNRSHSYFTRILEEVMVILKPRCLPNVAEDPGTQEPAQHTGQLTGWNDIPVIATRSQTKSKKQQRKHQRNKETHATRNTFGHLEVEEPSLVDDSELVNENEIAAETERPENPILIDRRYPNTSELNANELEPSTEEIRFAVFCLLEDLHRIRQFLRETWAKYRSHHTSLMNASITSNTAIELVRRLESGFANAFPQFLDWQEVLNGVFFTTNVDKVKGDETCSFSWEELDYMYFYPLNKLIAFRDNEKPDVPKYGRFYDPRLEQRIGDFSTKVKQDDILMTETLHEFFFYFRVPDKLPTEDELIMGLRQVRTNGKVALSTCFALQIFVDIHCGLGEDVNKGFLEWELTMTRFLAIMLNYVPRAKTWRAINHCHSGELQMIKDSIKEWLETDAITQEKKNFWGSDYRKRSPPEKPYFIFSNNPLLCGVLTFAYHLNMHSDGLNHERLTRTILVTAHLYNALRIEGHLEICWPSMDTMIEDQNANKVFIGSPPTTPKDCFTRFCLVQGQSAQMLAPNRRKTHETRKTRQNREAQRVHVSTMGADFVPFQREIRSKKGLRNLAGPTQILQVFWERYCQNKLIPEVTIDQFEPLLNGRFQAQKEVSSSKDKLRNKWEQTQKLSPLELLAVLHDWLCEEEPSLLIDYYTLQLDSWKLLQRATLATGGAFDEWIGRSKDCHDDLKQTYLPMFLFEARIRTPLESWAKEIFGVIGGEWKQTIQESLKTTGINVARNVIPAQSIPERGPTTLWGILQPNHPTHNGTCIHIGYCGRQLERRIREFRDN